MLAVALAVRPDLRTGPVLRTGGMSTRRAVAVALGLGAFGYATQSTLYFTALQHMDASLLSLIFYTYPVLVTVAPSAAPHPLDAARVTALSVASLGTGLVLLGAAPVARPRRGAAGVGTAVTYTGYILVAETVVGRLPRSCSPPSSWPARRSHWSPCRGDRRPDARLRRGGWLWLVCIALVSTVTAILTFFAGLQRAGASNAAILSALEPVVTTTLAALTLREFLTPRAADRWLARAVVRVVLQGPTWGRRRRQTRNTEPVELPEWVAAEAARA